VVIHRVPYPALGPKFWLHDAQFKGGAVFRGFGIADDVDQTAMTYQEVTRILAPSRVLTIFDQSLRYRVDNYSKQMRNQPLLKMEMTRSATILITHRINRL
jgi:hypothetical protein